MKKLNLYVFAVLFGIFAAHAVVHGKQAQGSGGGSGDKVNNPEIYGVATVTCVNEVPCVDCVAGKQDVTLNCGDGPETGDLWQCPLGTVLVVDHNE